MIGKRRDWTGHNFPSEGWSKTAGSSVTWFRTINGKQFVFTAWLDREQAVTTMQVGEWVGDSYSTRHCFTRQEV